MISTLKNYYKRKYCFERGDDAAIIKKVDIPASRFEATVKFFPQYFRGGDILELGGGSGIVANSLLKLDARISTYTISETCLPRLEALKKNINDNRLKITELDAENIPQSIYGKYDAVIMIALIEHLINPLNAMRNIRNVLKPGGFVYIDTPNIAKYTRRIKLLFGRFPSTASKNEGLTTYENRPVDLYDEGHLHYFTYRSLSIMLLEQCGFSKIKKLGYHVGRVTMGRYIFNMLASFWPELFSELIVLAYK